MGNISNNQVIPKEMLSVAIRQQLYATVSLLFYNFSLAISWKSDVTGKNQKNIQPFFSFLVYVTSKETQRKHEKAAGLSHLTRHAIQ